MFRSFLSFCLFFFSSLGLWFFFHSVPLFLLLCLTHWPDRRRVIELLAENRKFIDYEFKKKLMCISLRKKTRRGEEEKEGEEERM